MSYYVGLLAFVTGCSVLLLCVNLPPCTTHAVLADAMLARRFQAHMLPAFRVYGCFVDVLGSGRGGVYMSTGGMRGGYNEGRVGGAENNSGPPDLHAWWPRVVL